MTICTVKLVCDGVERSVRYINSNRRRRSSNTVYSFDELHSSAADLYDIEKFHLTYLDENDSACRVTDNDSLDDATASASHGVLHLKVSAYSVQYESSDDEAEEYLEYNAARINSEGEEIDSESEELPIKRRAHTHTATTSVLAQRFSVHNVECYRCEKSPIHGMSYTYKKDGDYKLCHDCMPYYNKSNWSVTPFPWTRSVPRAPLSSDDYSVRDEVRHLQKVLTELGYLKLEETAEYQGSFQWRTERAVEAFRRKYKIHGNDLTIYNKRTERKLAEAVSDL